MNLTRIQEAFVKKIESLDLGLPILTSNALPASNCNEFIEIVATEAGRVSCQQNIEKWLGAVDCRITVPVSTGNKKINHFAEKITELFSVLDDRRSYLTTTDGITLTVTEVRQFPLYISGTGKGFSTCSVNCRICFETFLQPRR
ncbi:MAG: hypothetical protein FWC43_14550 [Planctomycetaceae bacterium]|nr:hypothetical protein [Planctomycetaceae bacterium]